MTDTVTVCEDGALYFDRHGDVWRAVGTELVHVKRADENTPDPTVNPWTENAELVARNFGPMRHLTDRLEPAHEALLLWALIGKNTADDDVLHRALALIDMLREEATR